MFGCVGFEGESEQRFRVRSADIEPPGRVFDLDAVDFGQLPVGVFLFEFFKDGILVRDFAVDFTGVKISVRRRDE